MHAVISEHPNFPSLLELNLDSAHHGRSMAILLHSPSVRNHDLTLYIAPDVLSESRFENTNHDIHSTGEYVSALLS